MPKVCPEVRARYGAPPPPEAWLPATPLAVDPGHRQHVKRQIPGRVPGVLPLVGHRDDVGVVEVRPGTVAAGMTLVGRRRPGGVAGEPSLHVVVEELLAPPQPPDRLPQDHANAVLFLASDDAAFITGIDLRVDGGTLATWGTRSQADPTAAG